MKWFNDAKVLLHHRSEDGSKDLFVHFSAISCTRSRKVSALGFENGPNPSATT